jgi:hypothetical protein
MDTLRGEHVSLDQFRERQQHGGAGPDMIGHSRDRKLYALARKLFALPVERLMIGVFVDQDHRQQTPTPAAAFLPNCSGAAAQPR